MLFRSDLVADPDERTNLADRPEQTSRVAEMMARLGRLMTESGDAAALRVDQPQPAAWTPPVKKAGPAKKG